MPPDGAAMVFYGIVKQKELRDELAAAPISTREAMLAAIDTLQENPYPDDHQTVSFGPSRITTAVVEVPGQNRYLLTYTVDEEKEKVFVITVREKRFN